MKKIKPDIKIIKILKELNYDYKDLKTIIDNQNPNDNISRATLSKILNGKVTNYSIFTLLRICKALKKTPNDILDYERF
jgi:DNA-binding Xre family transcriptional regulator